MTAPLLLPALPWGDHGGAVTSPEGGLGRGWLLVAGRAAVALLAARALFAPEREEPREAGPTGRRPKRR